MKHTLYSIIAIALTSLSSLAHAEAPPTLTFEGVITDAWVFALSENSAGELLGKACSIKMTLAPEKAGPVSTIVYKANLKIENLKSKGLKPTRRMWVTDFRGLKDKLTANGSKYRREIAQHLTVHFVPGSDFSVIEKYEYLNEADGNSFTCASQTK